MITLITKCMECGEEHKVEVKESDYLKWTTGTYIQDAFPYLTAAQRELLISKMCGTCFDKLFNDEE